MGGGWNASKRCTEIARRLEEYRRDGLKELKTEVKNGYNTVCVTTERGGDSDCRLVFTVPSGRDAIATRDSVFRNITMADSGQQTQGVNTLTDSGNSMDIFKGIFGSTSTPTYGGGYGGSTPVEVKKNRDAIDLRPFLSTSDGGTATQLRTMPSKKTKLR
jgi:hypothetical protein